MRSKRILQELINKDIYLNESIKGNYLELVERNRELLV